MNGRYRQVLLYMQYIIILCNCMWEKGILVDFIKNVLFVTFKPLSMLHDKIITVDSYKFPVESYSAKNTDNLQSCIVVSFNFISTL